MSRPEYRVPSKNYRRQYRALLPELLPELERVLLEEDPVLGLALEAFEREWAAYTGTAHAVGLNSGTDALWLGLRAAGVAPGDEVITAANTFIATVSAILLAGARPVLVDPDPRTMNLDAAGVAGALSRRTAAVIPVHLYGALAPMEPILEVCRRHGLAVIEDAAQAHGARGRDGRRAGAYGVMGCFSFHPSKNLGAFGDGGMVTTSDSSLEGSLRILRNLGQRSKHEAARVAPNSKLDTLQAAILRLKLRRLEEWNRRRRHLASIYRRALLGVGDLRLPDGGEDGSHVYHLYVVRTARRDELRRHLESRGIRAGLHYPVPPHLQPLDVDLGYRAGAFPVAEACSRTVLSLPVAPELTDEEVEYVCQEVRSFFGA